MRSIKRLFNQLLFSFHVRIESLPTDYFDLSLYSESSRPADPKYVNIGALDFLHPLWHNLDNPTDWNQFSKRQDGNIHLPHDLMSGKPLPILDNTLSIAYCSHVIEHLRTEDVQFLFNEIYRVLKPGGTFRLVAPDMDQFYDAYLRRDELLFQSGVRLYECPTIEQKLLIQFASPLVLSHPAIGHRKYSDEEIRHVVRSMPREESFEFFLSQVPTHVQKQYPADHINWFTATKTKSLLTAAQFSYVWQSARGQSHLPVLRNTRFFDPYGDHSLYFESVK
jgi:predicted SAM-dependent methyltransferase